MFILDRIKNRIGTKKVELLRSFHYMRSSHYPESLNEQRKSHNLPIYILTHTAPYIPLAKAQGEGFWGYQVFKVIRILPLS